MSRKSRIKSRRKTGSFHHGPRKANYFERVIAAASGRRAKRRVQVQIAKTRRPRPGKNQATPNKRTETKGFRADVSAFFEADMLPVTARQRRRVYKRLRKEDGVTGSYPEPKKPHPLAQPHEPTVVDLRPMLAKSHRVEAKLDELRAIARTWRPGWAKPKKNKNHETVRVTMLKTPDGLVALPRAMRRNMRSRSQRVAAQKARRAKAMPVSEQKGAADG